MSLGHPITVERQNPAPNLVNQVELAPFDPTQMGALFPVAPDDPQLRFMPPSVRAERTNPDVRVPLAHYESPGQLSWGMYANEQLVGAAALNKTYLGRLTVDMYLLQAWRGTGCGNLAYAGIIRAAFTPGYVAAHDPSLAADMQPWVLRAYIHTGDKTTKRLAAGFGFVFTSASSLEPGYRASAYELIGGVFRGEGNAKSREGTVLAYNRLKDYKVTSHGAVRIAPDPQELLRELN